MDTLAPKIYEISRKITETENKRKKLAELVRNYKSNLNIAFPINHITLDNTKIAGIDGGVAKKCLHGFDIVLVRGVGVCFWYQNGRLFYVEYHPSKNTSPSLFVLDGLSELEWTCTPSIIRQTMEIKTAIETAEKFKPDVLLLDGSIIPHYTDKPEKNSKVYMSYEEMLELYKNLFAICTENGIMLAGVVEDSRGTRFCKIIEGKIRNIDEFDDNMKKILDNTKDTNILFWVLDKGERTHVFPYTENPDEHPIIRDIPAFKDKILSFYMKTAKFDRPLRVDFLGGTNIIGKLSSIIYAISSYHSAYGLPNVLIEADQAAKLSDNDIELIYSQIIRHTGALPGILKLRRELRPF
ncbi:MAG: DNA double-strand break repair nuclease NurA [Candidatus Aenigmarchaeota archaeon]|nr:DNA double-strand break repair nuclease NurA [Candidatus Aenigmarchaeota archaeon]